MKKIFDMADSVVLPLMVVSFSLILGVHLSIVAAFYYLLR